MLSGGGKSLSALGFLTVNQDPDCGVLGGYLLLSPNGRPLEFYCTEPVKPNRAQEILYGPTLESYLYGEQIGQTLVKKSKLKPPVVLIDSLNMLSVQEFVDMPIVLVGKIEPHTGDPCLSSSTLSRQTTIGQTTLSWSDQNSRYSSSVGQALEQIAQRIDLTEPFERIQEAIREAQRIGRAA